MIIKCKECGKEYSYGKKIYHCCNGNSIYHGTLFEDNGKELFWNCETILLHEKIAKKE